MTVFCREMRELFPEGPTIYQIKNPVRESGCVARVTAAQKRQLDRLSSPERGYRRIIAEYMTR